MIDVDDVDKAVAFLRDNAVEAAQARADRLFLDNFSKRLMSLIMREKDGTSVAAQERDALADQRYGVHLEGLKEAIFRDEKMKNLREAAQAKIEVWRSQLSWAKTQEKI